MTSQNKPSSSPLDFIKHSTSFLEPTSKFAMGLIGLANHFRRIFKVASNPTAKRIINAVAKHEANQDAFRDVLRRTSDHCDASEIQRIIDHENGRSQQRMYIEIARASWRNSWPRMQSMAACSLSVMFAFMMLLLWVFCSVDPQSEFERHVAGPAFVAVCIGLISIVVTSLAWIIRNILFESATTKRLETDLIALTNEDSPDE